jgi:hypothetical protein
MGCFTRSDARFPIDCFACLLISCRVLRASPDRLRCSGPPPPTPSAHVTILSTNSGSSCRWLRMIPSLGTNAGTDTLPGSGCDQCAGRTRTSKRIGSSALTRGATTIAADGFTQLHTERALELPTAGIKPKAFGTCPEKRLRAKTIGARNRKMTGIAL